MLYVEFGKMLVRVWQKDYDLVDETILNAGDFTRVNPVFITSLKD